MRRWTEGDEPPERKHPDTMFGSAIHHAIHLAEEGVLTDEQAMQSAFDEYGQYLDPETMERLEADFAVYRERDYKGVRTVLNEGELRVPLLKHEGETIYFRCKIDRLYERISAPGRFIHIDYKSSKWRKSEAEVHADPQMWSYNFAIHEYFPECDRLEQVYDQLEYGQVATSKSTEQRAQIKRWLKRQVRAILADETAEPKFNEWCPYCPLLPDCPEPKRTAQFAAARIAALAPADPESGKLVLDPDLMEVYVRELPEIATARKALEDFEKTVKATLREMPEQVRAFHGYELHSKRSDAWTPEALRQAHEIMGDEFFALVRLTKGRIKDYLGDDKERADALLALAEKEASNPNVRKLGD